MRSGGFKCRRVHDRRDKKVRDLEVSGRRTVLVWSRRRMVCDNCDSRFLEDHPAFEGALTGRLARRLVADAKVMTFSAAARRHGVHWHGVRALVDVWSALVSGGREPPLYLVEWLWRGSVGAGCSPRRVGLYPPVT